jgi:hypothetical protein
LYHVGASKNILFSQLYFKILLNPQIAILERRRRPMRISERFFVFALLALFVVFLNSCTSSSPARKESLAEFGESVGNIDDMRMWFVLFDSRRTSPESKASFVMSLDKLKAYVLFKESVLTKSNVERCDLDKKFYNCPRGSVYCSMCIDLRGLSLNCDPGKNETVYDAGGTVISNDQKVMIRKLTMVNENLSKSKIVFHGMPANFVFNNAANAKEKKIDDLEHYKFSNTHDSDPEVVCRRDKDEVTCNATVTLASL